MREALRGYAVATAERDGTDRASLARDVSAAAELLHGSESLREVLEDGGVATDVRRGILSELLATRIGAPAVALVGFAVEVERPSELPGALDSLAERLGAEVSAAADADPAAGRHALRERIEGYAIAQFETVDRAVLGDAEDALFRFARIVESSRELAKALSDPFVAWRSRCEVASELVGRQVPRVALDLITYAIRNTRGPELIGILDWLVNLTSAERGKRVAQVRAAVDLDDDLKATVRRALSGLAGRDVELRVETDATLIGGMIALVGDLVVDTSVKHRLDVLEAALLQADLSAVAAGPSAGTGSGDGRAQEVGGSAGAAGTGHSSDGNGERGETRTDG